MITLRDVDCGTHSILLGDLQPGLVFVSMTLRRSISVAWFSFTLLPSGIALNCPNAAQIDLEDLCSLCCR